MLRTRIGKRSRLYIFGLVIQDHIESIGKANTIKRGWGYDDDLVAQMLSGISLNPSATLTVINPKEKSRSHRFHPLSPTEMNHFSHKPNPSKSDFLIMTLGLTENELPTFCYLLSSNRCHRDDEVGQTETGMLLSLHESDKPRLYIRSHRNF